ncbi:MAG: hypothetical protein ABF904_12795 [Ethanoligenens sp.]
MKDLKEKVSGENMTLKDFNANLRDVEELQPIESPNTVLGPWFFVVS